MCFTTFALCFTIFDLMLGGTNVVSAQTDEEPLFLFRGARPLGLGNAYEAIADDMYAIHYNPAGLAQVDEHIFQFLIIRGRATTDFIDEATTIDEFMSDTIDPLVDSENPLTDTDPDLVAARERLVERAEQILVETHGLDIGLPSLGFIKPFTLADHKAAAAISFYNHAVANVRIAEAGLSWADPVMAMLDNPILYSATIQSTLATALSVEIPVAPPYLQAANVGLGFRLIRRGTFTDVNNPFTIEDILDPDQFKQNYFDLEGDDSLTEFVQKNIDTTTGYSADLGTLFLPVDGLRVGLVWRNILSNIDVEYSVAENLIIENRGFPSNLVVSVAAQPLTLLAQPMEWLDLTIAASLDNPNGDDRLGDLKLNSYRDSIHLGAEIILTPSRWLSLAVRMGNNQGFITYGTTLRLFGFLDFNVGRYGNLEADWWFGSTEISF